MHVDHRLARLKRDIRQLHAGGRPAGRDDRFRTGQSSLGVLAVRVGNPEVVTPAHLGHIGNAGRKDPFVTGQGFVHVVSDAVGGQTQVAGHHGVAGAAQVLGLDHVPEAKTHIKTPIGQPCHAAREQRIRPALTQGREVRARGFIQGLACSQGAKQPTALQVGLHDAGNPLRRPLFPTKGRERDRDLGQAHTRDIDPELGLGRARAQDCKTHSVPQARQQESHESQGGGVPDEGHFHGAVW